ncbi:MAG: cyanophycin synthetase [Candidatus Saccharibacteria bacterium]|nr:cyanophycin synthetase [Candidatus Saccharibacteria bacterium]
MKRVFRSVVAKILESQVRRLQKKRDFKVVAVVGSIGKTSTKLAIGRSLSKVAKVRYQDGNYNDRVTVPLVFFGRQNPRRVWHFWSWLAIFIRNELALRKPYIFEWVILELGTDGPGQIREFAYLDVDLAVVTAVTPEHMEQFGDLDAVAKEELSVANFSRHLLINRDLCDEKYIRQIGKSLNTYGTSKEATIRIASDYPFDLKSGENVLYSINQRPLLPKQYGLAAVMSVLRFARQDDSRVIHSLLTQELEVQTPGRMQVLPGINQSEIIDDTYNAQPDAVKMALEVLQRKTGPQKIAILGNMNELGQKSAELHKEIGQSCKPKNIDLLVTIGADANEYLAQEAKKNGCDVKAFTNPYQAGVFLKDRVKHKAVILAKGSQNGVFAEEAIKPLLKNPHDEKKLVRQSKDWLIKKRNSFEVMR